MWILDVSNELSHGVCSLKSLEESGLASRLHVNMAAHAVNNKYIITSLLETLAQTTTLVK